MVFDDSSQLNGVRGKREVLLCDGSACKICNPNAETGQQVVTSNAKGGDQAARKDSGRRASFTGLRKGG